MKSINSAPTLFVLLLFLWLGDDLGWNVDCGAAALVVLGERLDPVPLAGNQTLHVPLRPRRGLVEHQLTRKDTQVRTSRHQFPLIIELFDKLYLQGYK